MMMMMTPYVLLSDLCESRLIPSEMSLKPWRVKDLNQLAYLYFLALRVLLGEKSTRHWAIQYCGRVARSEGFDTWRSDGNDFYVLLYATSTANKAGVSSSAVRDWLDHVHHRDFDERTHSLFNRLDAMFRISDSSLKSMRRVVMHWSDTDARERQDVIDQLIIEINRLAPRSELLEHLKHNSRQYNDIKESASAGGTGASSIATAVGGLGAGFEPPGQGLEKSVYGKKSPVIIQRVAKKKIARA